MHDFFKLRIRPWGFLTSVGCLALLGSVAGFLGRYAWWLDIGSHFRVQYTVLFAVLTVCYLAGKKRGWALACLLLAVINFLPVATYRFPARGYDQVAGPALKVSLMNVNSEFGKPDEVARFLQRENPDVVILEEINDEWMRRLSPSLNGYPGRIVQTREDNFGIGVFSRTKITSSQVVYFGTADVPSIIARMDLNGQAFTLVATHPLPPGGAEYSRMRNEQLDCVAGYVSTNHDPLILLGDLNITPWSPLYRDFIRRSGLVNSSQGRAIHPSWPSFSPLFLIPIDHCLHNAGIAIKSERVGKSIGSDHYPVIVEFGLKDGGDLLPWNARTYSDGHALARVIYDQVSALTKDRSLKSVLIPLLTNTNVTYTDQDGTAITVRDMAFTILNEANEVGLPEGPTRSKLICCCTGRGEILYRAHIPVISAEGFRKTSLVVGRLPTD